MVKPKTKLDTAKPCDTAKPFRRGGIAQRDQVKCAPAVGPTGDRRQSVAATPANDVPPFGEFTYYPSTVVNTPIPNGDRTAVTLTPGLRTHVGNDWYFLAGLPLPFAKKRIADLGMIFWFMKAW
jgi:hypothetical protein